MTEQPIRIAALIGGGGRTLMNLAAHIDRGELDAEIAVVIASRADITGVEKARERGFAVRIAERKAFDDEDHLHDAIGEWVRQSDADLICLCGYLRKVRIDPDFAGRIINIHPSLLPAFGGLGMYGKRVHRAVLESGIETTGCTVHFVTDEYDMGPIILQRTCPVYPDDDEYALAARVFEQECIAYPDAIGRIITGTVQLPQR